MKKKIIKLFHISTPLLFFIISLSLFSSFGPSEPQEKDTYNRLDRDYQQQNSILSGSSRAGFLIPCITVFNKDVWFDQEPSGDSVSGVLSTELLLLISILCIVMIIGYVFRYRRRQAIDQQDLFARQLLDSMETERKRIASELHDSIGQELLIIKNRALLALNDLKNRKIVREQLDEISNTASQALQETREITYNLRPYQIDRLGMTRAIESIITRVERTTAIKFTADVDPMDNLIPKEMEIYVYRIVQECVNNIIKHSRATEGRITIKRWHNRLNIDIVDNGVGFDYSAEKLKPGRGLGLHGIVERTRLIGGTMRIESNPGKGTRVLMTIKTFEQTYATQ